MTPKQERFAVAFLELGSAASAYRHVYATKPDLPGSTVWPEASRIKNLPKVSARIAQLRERHAEKTGVTIDTVTEQLRRAYEAAMAAGQPSAAVRACMALAKLHGLFSNPAEVEARSYVINAEPMTEEEWVEEYGQPRFEGSASPR